MKDKPFNAVNEDQVPKSSITTTTRTLEAGEKTTEYELIRSEALGNSFGGNALFFIDSLLSDHFS